MKLPQALLSIQPIAEAADILQRAVAAAVTATNHYNGLLARGLPKCVAPFDEAGAAARIAHAKAHDQIHRSSTEAEVSTAIAAERAACAKACAAAEADVAAAQAKLEAARQAHEAAERVRADAANTLFVLCQAHGDRLLDEMAIQALQGAQALYALAVEMAEVARAVSPGANVPVAGLRVTIPRKPSGVTEAGGRWGDFLADAAVVFGR